MAAGIRGITWVHAYAIEPEARARALLTRFGDGRFAVTHRTCSRTRARIRVARLLEQHSPVHTAAEVY